MINIASSAGTEGFGALLPAGATTPAAEVFVLEGRCTSMMETGAPPPEGAITLSFAADRVPGAKKARRGSFTEAERDNILCLLASPDGRFGSLEINAPVLIYTCRLGAGERITFRPAPGRKLWLRPLSGSLDLGSASSTAPRPCSQVDPPLVATIIGEELVTIHAASDSEFILLDLA